MPFEMERLRARGDSLMLFVKCRLKMMATHATAYDLGFAFINRKINNCCISQDYISYTQL